MAEQRGKSAKCEAGLEQALGRTNLRREKAREGDQSMAG